MNNNRLLTAALTAYILLLVAGSVALTFRPYPSDQDEYPAPPDFASFATTAEKKQAFFDYFRPIVQRQNDTITHQQQLLQNIADRYAQGAPLSRADRALVSDLAAEFAIETHNISFDALLAELNLRVGTLPESLVLAQAAIESAWGTSRFAMEGANYFGQWCYRKGCGLVPRQRTAGATHEVQTFNQPQDSVAAYFNNINTHPAYAKLREYRLIQHVNQQPITGLALANFLSQYSERGQAYIDEVRSVISYNNLE